MKKETKSTIYHNKIAEEYESSYTEPYWQLYFDVTWHTLQKYLPDKEGARILDAGGGTGYWSRKLAKKGFYIVCTDIAQKMLEVGSKLAEKEQLSKKIEFKLADITDMNCFDDNSFDMVLAQGDPVGYCSNPPKAIKELSRVAKKGAHVTVSVDNFFPQLGRLIPNNNPEQIDSLLKSHITEFPGGFPQYNFTVDELNSLFERAGLEVLEITGKLVFTNFITPGKINDLLSDAQFYRRLFELETKFNNTPSIVGLSNHIQIVGRKV